MDDAFFVLAGWAVIVGAMALYALSLVRRGRRLSREVPEEHRRWM